MNLFLKNRSIHLRKLRPREILHDIELLGIVLRTASHKAWQTRRYVEFEQYGRITEEISKWLKELFSWSVISQLFWYQGPKAFISQLTCPWILDASRAKNLHKDGILSEYQFLGESPSRKPAIGSHLHCWKAFWVFWL